MSPNRKMRHDHHHHGHHASNQQNNGNRVQNPSQNGNNSLSPCRCCCPKGCLSPNILIFEEDIKKGDVEVVHVYCNNDLCDQGEYMHIDCFNEWQEDVLNKFSASGRARSWTPKQRLQNLWTKKGYDLAYKACDCKCGRGHLRKDVHWAPPVKPKVIVGPRNERGGDASAGPGADPGPNAAGSLPNTQVENDNEIKTGDEVFSKEQLGQSVEEKDTDNGLIVSEIPVSEIVAPQAGENGGKKKKKKSKSKDAKLLNISGTLMDQNPANCLNQSLMMTNGNKMEGNGNGHTVTGTMHGSSSPPSSSPWSSIGSSLDSAYSSSLSSCVGAPVAVGRPRLNSVSSNASGSSAMYSAPGSPPSPPFQFGSPATVSSLSSYKMCQRKNSKEGGLDRMRHGSGGFFGKRMDFSSFNTLPWHKLNSIQIKMDDDFGNDDIRHEVLQVLINHRVCKVQCCVCSLYMTVYDRYPLLDGTFFISPIVHGQQKLLMKTTDGSVKHLNAVCMHCLGNSYTSLVCRQCGSEWDTSSLILGGVYNFDIFATNPCCSIKFQCSNCNSPLGRDKRRHSFFSEYSTIMKCDSCDKWDYHFAKPANMIYARVSKRQHAVY